MKLSSGIFLITKSDTSTGIASPRMMPTIQANIGGTDANILRISAVEPWVINGKCIRYISIDLQPKKVKILSALVPSRNLQPQHIVKIPPITRINFTGINA